MAQGLCHICHNPCYRTRIDRTIHGRLYPLMLCRGCCDSVIDKKITDQQILERLKLFIEKHSQMKKEKDRG